MSTTRTVLADEAQSYPLSELNDQPIAKGSESSIEQQQPQGDVVDRQPATPVLKLLVAGYSFFCAGISDGTREYYPEPIFFVSFSQSRTRGFFIHDPKYQDGRLYGMLVRGDADAGVTVGPLIPYILSSFHIGTGEIAIM